MEKAGPWRVRELRERLGIMVFDPSSVKIETITVDETARRLNICIGSVKRLIREGVLPATQLMPSALWQIPVSALDTEAVKIGVRAVNVTPSLLPASPSISSRSGACICAHIKPVHNQLSPQFRSRPAYEQTGQ
jgi:excisionase family DNA binding protein